MRFATVLTPAGPRLHVRARSGYVDLAAASGDPRLGALPSLLALGREGMGIAERFADGEGVEVPPEQLGPAVGTPGKILCLGRNYLEHALEGGSPPPSWPEVFVRFSTTLTGPFAEVVKPSLTERLDYEGELGVVIGEGGRYIRAEAAMSAVAGFVVLNDLSARDWQRASSQWTAGKNFDGTCPIGPEVVTVDEADPVDAALTTTVNGEVVQSARTSQMIFDVARSIEFFSSFTTLEPGDVIATGTPSGVGFARTPPLFLVPGDVVEVAIEGVGTIRNSIVADPDGPTNWAWNPLARAEAP